MYNSAQNFFFISFFFHNIPASLTSVDPLNLSREEAVPTPCEIAKNIVCSLARISSAEKVPCDRSLKHSKIVKAQMIDLKCHL